MMKRLLLLPALLAAPAVQAHPGLHVMGFWENLAHHLTEPDHLALLAAVVAGGTLLWRRSRRRSR